MTKLLKSSCIYLPILYCSHAVEEASRSFDYLRDSFDQDMVLNIVYSLNQVAYSLDWVTDLDTERNDFY